MSSAAASMPSRKLLFVLALSLVLAAFTVGRTYLGASSTEEPDEFLEVFEPFVDTGPERVVIDIWELPEAPRDPFLQVDLTESVPTTTLP